MVYLCFVEVFCVFLGFSCNRPGAFFQYTIRLFDSPVPQTLKGYCRCDWDSMTCGGYLGCAGSWIPEDGRGQLSYPSLAISIDHQAMV